MRFPLQLFIACASVFENTVIAVSILKDSLLPGGPDSGDNAGVAGFDITGAGDGSFPPSGDIHGFWSSISPSPSSLSAEIPSSPDININTAAVAGAVGTLEQQQQQQQSGTSSSSSLPSLLDPVLSPPANTLFQNPPPPGAVATYPIPKCFVIFTPLCCSGQIYDKYTLSECFECMRPVPALPFSLVL